MKLHITVCMQHNRNWLMNVSSHWNIGQIRAVSEIIDQMLSRIHQKNSDNLELWELNHREWYLVSEDEGFVCILSKVQWNNYSSHRKPYNILMCINFLKSILYKFLLDIFGFWNTASNLVYIWWLKSFAQPFLRVVSSSTLL